MEQRGRELDSWDELVEEQLMLRQRPASNTPPSSKRWISTAHEVFAPPMPPSPSLLRPSPPGILQTSPPPPPKGYRLQVNLNLCPPCTYIPCAPGASRPPIRSLGEKRRSNIARSGVDTQGLRPSESI